MNHLTYGKLDEVLRAFGFSSRMATVNVPARVYQHASGAVLLFPAFDDGMQVLPHHLAAVEMTLDNYAIARPFDFRTALQKQVSA